MSNVLIIEDFLRYYQNHDWEGMHRYLDETVKFSDFAFDITGEEVKAMWHWFSITYGGRPPIEVPEFKVEESTTDHMTARYRVKYLYGEKQRLVDYWIKSSFRLRNDKIIEQVDTFGSISQYQFAEMAFGKPISLLALTPLFSVLVKGKASEKLKKFMRDLGYL